MAQVSKNEKWGFLRESKEDAIKAGIDEETKLHQTGLDEYLNFPEQYKLNLKHLKSLNDDFLTGASLLEKEVENLSHN